MMKQLLNSALVCKRRYLWDANCGEIDWNGRTEGDPGRGCLPIDPEGHPGYDDDQVTRKINLQQVIPDLSLQLEPHEQNFAKI